MADYLLINESGSENAPVQYILDQLVAYNTQQTGGGDGYQPLNLFLKDTTGGIGGGIIGSTYWGWLHVAVLWLSEGLRGQGYGHTLLREAEKIARERGCHHAHLDTMSFQALPFYLKEGYIQYGHLDDIPIGHSRYFLQKPLSPALSPTADEPATKPETH